jgi:hypothetical protein
MDVGFLSAAQTLSREFKVARSEFKYTDNRRSAGLRHASDLNVHFDLIMSVATQKPANGLVINWMHDQQRGLRIQTQLELTRARVTRAIILQKQSVN